MPIDLEHAHQTLWEWCRARDFAGYDPFDALNSRLFQSLPLKHSRAARLAWTQLCKRSPLNLRPMALVPLGKNPKGTALFALAALADFRRLRTSGTEADARALLDDLIEVRLASTKSGATCWGYDFDWQGRAFYAPRGTPTIVPTAFAARALLEAAHAFGDDNYLQLARSACDFIVHDLNRADETEDEVCFSYSPLDHTRIFNASLLAAETLAAVAAATKESELSDWAWRAARYVVRHQRPDGSWAYGTDDYQSWADNFHTAFVLTSLSRIIRAFGSNPPAGFRSGTLNAGDLELALRRGYDFWRARFFLANGWPKYYADRLYPVDAHAAGAAIATMSELQWLDSAALDLAGKVASWAIDNLRSRQGFFYYQRRRFYTIRTPFMRWSEAWMLYGLSRLLEVTGKHD
ncbi:MAG: hypothetical protein QOD75_1387 [Blastocatellia bacterium]|jgi:hypothetical protein|nr:hypothetical protein [Blastocatellia bacterium]